MNAISTPSKAAKIEGFVLSVRGAVVEVRFGQGQAPAIDTAMIVKWDRPETLILEVHSYVDPSPSAASHFRPPTGSRGASRWRRPAPQSQRPSGTRVLGRLLDVVGDLRDNGPPLPADTPRRGIHAPPPRLKDETSSVDDVRDRHQGDRSAGAARAGRQGGDVRRRGRRQDRAGDGAHPFHGREI